MHYIDKVNLTKFADSYPHTLSGGMKQRVAIARGMAMEPDILLMDEPFAALDALTRRRMQDELLRLWDDTRFTVLFVTHSIPEAIKIGMRILLLSPHPGQVRAELNGGSAGGDPSSLGKAYSAHALRGRNQGGRECLTFRSSTPGRRRCRCRDFGRRSSATRILSPQIAVVEKPLSRLERLFNQAWLRKAIILIVLALMWEVYARYLDNDLLFPTLSETMHAAFDSIVSGVLPRRAMVSIRVLLMGYASGVTLAALLTSLAITSRVGADFLETITSMLNPLPAVALLPLALIWFGLGDGSLIFVLINSVTWAIALNTHAGFLAVSKTLKMVGKNYGLTGPRYVMKILIPAAFPSILTGLKIGWAFAWRTLIAAELVFGVSSGSGGLGWFIFENKNLLDIPNVFAGLLTVIVIGLLVENLIFRTIEQHTLVRWGVLS